jgi:hypothetical protein
LRSREAGSAQTQARKAPQASRRTNELALCDTVRDAAFVIYRYHRHAHLEEVYANSDLCVFCAFSLAAHKANGI